MHVAALVGERTRAGTQVACGDLPPANGRPAYRRWRLRASESAITGSMEILMFRQTLLGAVVAASLGTVATPSLAAGQRREAWARGDLDRDGVRDGVDRSRDGDGVANRRDNAPDNARRQ